MIDKSMDRSAGGSDPEGPPAARYGAENDIRRKVRRQNAAICGLWRLLSLVDEVEDYLNRSISSKPKNGNRAPKVGDFIVDSTARRSNLGRIDAAIGKAGDFPEGRDAETRAAI